MMRVNVIDAPKEPTVAHDGRGRIAFVRPFTAGDFESALAFIDYVELPPGSSIGLHTHGNDEEVYFIVEGRGTMTTNAERFAVGAGDLVVNRRHWSHGLENDSDAPLRVLVWDVACPPRSQRPSRDGGG
jgi:mannose-6-phosphate isomerase-like protein (cupin superfamily)